VGTDTVFVLTLLVLCYAVVSGLVKKWYTAPALIFALFGIVLGPFAFNGSKVARTPRTSPSSRNWR